MPSRVRARDRIRFSRIRFSRIRFSRIRFSRVPSRVRARDLPDAWKTDAWKTARTEEWDKSHFCHPSPPMRVFLRLAPPAQQQTAAHGPGMARIA